MGQLKNKKHEMFAQNLVKNGCNMRQAYLSTFKTNKPNTAAVNANALMRRPEVRERVNELVKQNETTIKVTIETVLADIQKGKELALKSGHKPNLSAYARFVEMEGRYLKMFTDRIEIDLSAKSDKDLLREFKEIFGQVEGLLSDID